MNVVFYHPRLRLADGGVVRAIIDWCTILASRGHRVVVITCDTDDLPPAWTSGEPLNPTVRLIARPGRFGVLPKGAVAQIRQTIADADVVHLHEIWLPSNLQLRRACLDAGAPYVVSLHGMLDDWSMAQRRLKKVTYLRLFGRRLLNDAAAIHCTAEAEKQQASRWHVNGFTAVLPYVVDLSPYHTLPGPERAVTELKLSDGGPRLLFLSRLHPKKGVETLLRAIALVAESHPRVRAWIAGPGDEAYLSTLQTLVQSLKIEPNVAFLGMVSGSLKYSLYQAADLFVLPTSQENFGLVLIEALACGTPVVTTRGVDIWQELQAAGAAIVEPRPEALADSIRAMVASQDDRRLLGQRGHKWVMTNLNPETVAAGYERLYADASDRRTN